MNRTLIDHLHLVPEVDVVVGIPRSGMLPASILALSLNARLADIDSFAEGRVFASGQTRGQDDSLPIQSALIVDDSIRSGGTMRRIRERLSHLSNVTYCAVYGSKKSHPEVDFIFEHVPGPRAFEWNVMHHPGILGIACVDIDGILCADPVGQQNDDGAAYLKFLTSPSRRFTPTGVIHTIVTSRLEKYRPETERWLASCGIRYQHLEMLDLPDAETRRRLGSHGKFKASVYKRTPTFLFIESEEWQAREIARKSGKPVLSFHGTPHMVYPLISTPRGLLWGLRQAAAGMKRRLVNEA